MADVNMYELFKPGDLFNGYCEGHFGREGYGSRVCVQVRLRYALFEYCTEYGQATGRAIVLNDDECEGLTRKKVEAWMAEEQV